MMRVVALLFALALAVPAAAADLPRPILPVERMQKEVHLHPSLGQTRAEKSRKGRPWNALAIAVPPQLNHSVLGK
jgi:hypothetical protein